MTLAELGGALARFGLNLALPLPVEEYDRIAPPPWQTANVAPGTEGVLVVGNGGGALWEHFRRSPEAEQRRDPLDSYTERALRETAESLDPPGSVALYTDRRQDAYLPMVALGRRAGCGSPGRVGVLIHPEYGPWIALRGLLYLRDPLPFEEPEPFDPCSGCPAPCAVACRGGVLGPDGVDVEGCFRTKILDSTCRRRCDARLACVVGPEHAYSSEQFLHHQRVRWRPTTLRHAVRVLGDTTLRRS
ncbi:MAG: hypothetical protein V3V67_00785 [Myxococcota bacterium]